MRIGIIANPEKALISSVIPELIQWLQENKQQVFISDENKALVSDKKIIVKLKDITKTSDVILAIGGDGTLLKAARIVGNSGIPILGINLGGLGFLTEVALDNLYPALTRLIRADYEIELRMVLEANVKQRPLYALNDAVIMQTGVGRMLQFTVYIDDKYVSEFSSDGIIISTPTGSTAYSLAAFGPILHPKLESIVVNLICPHTLGARPIVVSDDSTVKIECKSKKSALVIDGQERVLLNQGEKVLIRKADYKIKLIKSSARDFYEILRTKLKWGGGKER
ncbi:MAG: NAD(+)/NADH kinase [bacterium]|nr:NAD(+)/NADH kinase [bacterium]